MQKVHSCIIIMDKQKIWVQLLSQASSKEDLHWLCAPWQMNFRDVFVWPPVVWYSQILEHTT